MHSDFKILVYKNKNDLFLKLEGDFNSKFVNNLIYMLIKYCHCIPKVFINNNSKKNGHPSDLGKI
jgi:hypothetical protein